MGKTKRARPSGPGPFRKRVLRELVNQYLTYGTDGSDRWGQGPELIEKIARKLELYREFKEAVDSAPRVKTYRMRRTSVEEFNVRARNDGQAYRFSNNASGHCSTVKTEIIDRRKED